jgi:DNA-binding MarR family transcriptional regulator
VRVHLTPRGQALKRRLDDRVHDEQHALLAGVEPADADRLVGVLAGLADRLT